MPTYKMDLKPIAEKAKSDAIAAMAERFEALEKKVDQQAKKIAALEKKLKD